MRILLIICLLVGFSLHAQADPIDFTDHETYFNDGLSGLDWMHFNDPSVFLWRTGDADTIESIFDVGGAYEGWTFATGLQFDKLVFNYTGLSPTTNYERIEHEFGTLDGLLELFGPNSLGNPLYSISGLLADMNEEGDRRYVATIISLTSSVTHSTCSTPTTCEVISIVTTEHSNTMGHGHSLSVLGGRPPVSYTNFLVRETALPVPTPMTLALFAFGLAGLGLSRRLR